MQLKVCSTALEKSRRSKFYVLNEKLQSENHEKVKENLKNEYSKLAVKDDVCAFLDINNAILG
jgi:hypothetical protein